MAAPTPSKARDPQVAVGPLNSIAPDDSGVLKTTVDAEILLIYQLFEGGHTDHELRI